jgi:ubiquinone/menaquinone biosynthesis C-methylase UbiE
MFGKFRQRSYELENLDRGSYSAEEYEGCISELQFVNKYFGDSWTLKRTLIRHVEKSPVRDFSVLDVGAGSGELLRVTASWARETGRTFHGVGVELNERSSKAINEESTNFHEIASVRADARFLPFAAGEFDYAMCSLFTHHFVELEIINILREMSRVAKRRIFVIDLVRHPVAYFLYTTVGKLFLHNRLLREDGALSILRSFTGRELRQLGENAGLQDINVSRHLPYRLVLSAEGQAAVATKPHVEMAERAA